MILIGIGLDCSVTPLEDNWYLLQTTDFFYPLIEDPYLMGNYNILYYVTYIVILIFTLC